MVLYDANFVVELVITFNEHHYLSELSWIEMSVFSYFQGGKAGIAMVFDKVNEF